MRWERRGGGPLGVVAKPGLGAVRVGVGGKSSVRGQVQVQPEIPSQSNVGGGCVVCVPSVVRFPFLITGPRGVRNC